MQLAATISEHPIVAHAVGECVGDIIERRGDSPDLLVLCISDRLIGATEDIAAASAALLHPDVMIGVPCIEMSVGQRSSVGNGGLGMLALWHTRPSSTSGQVAVEPEWQVRASERVTSVRLAPDAHPKGAPSGAQAQVDPTGSVDRTSHAGSADLTGPVDPADPADPVRPSGIAHLAGSSGTLLLFTDPVTLPAQNLAEQVSAAAPDLSVIVATAGSLRPRAGAGLVLDGAVFGDGAVGVFLPADLPHRFVSSFGFAAIGARFAIDVTSLTSTGDVTRIRELNGQPAKEMLQAVIEGLAPAERAAAVQGLHLRWICPALEDSTPQDDSKARITSDVPRYSAVLGVDGEAIAVAGDLPNNATSVQFQVRDQESLDADLQRVVARNAEMAGGVFLIVDRPERAVSAASAYPAPQSIRDLDGYRGSADVIGADAVIISEEASRSDFLGIRCGEVLIADRSEVVSADRAVTILGLVE